MPASLLQAALQAYRRADLTTARRLAEEAARLAPQREEPWLLLAAMASPRASIHFIKKALALDPNSHRAQQALQWAQRRLAESAGQAGQVTETVFPITSPPEATQSIPKVTTRPVPVHQLILSRPSPLPWLLGLLLLSFCLALLLIMPVFHDALAAQDPYFSLQLAQAWFQATPTSSSFSFAPAQTSTATSFPTSSPTLTPTLIKTQFTLTPSLTPTDNTPTVPPNATATPFQPLPPTDTPTPFPTELPWTPPPPTLTPTPLPVPWRPDIVADDERWIEVNLSLQQAYAWVGSQFVRGFIVSTGTARHPTVTGIFRIYVKYRYANMSGPGYFLRDVPYVMYFYKDYGLHGTYWHNNFGTPMSHGCVNFRTEDAAWLFDWAEVGTIVAIHY